MSFSNTHLIVFGETRGTNESPQLIQSVLCEFVNLGIPIRLGVMAEHDQNESLNQLVRSNFSEQQAFDAAPKMWSASDGRGSAAMLKLLRQVALWREENANIELFAFEVASDETFADHTQSRYQTMASIVDGSAEQFDGAVILIASRQQTKLPIESTETHSNNMVELLKARPVISLQMVHDGGEAYGAHSNEFEKRAFGEFEIPENHPRRYSSWSINLEKFGPHYTGAYSTGFITPSPPAFPAEH